ncbi:Alpha/Beta hydrolase protein [Lasiosphaeris hirsuta]|uniref:Alpha/Beta hydrolase protein n=1 Tax=Lasiosphaeris hirsuta TaxID=260670 RepID=A0AA40DY23_9PEZI|nr:Alpha/Beta hydrolase protein [Lasiosphaeris hirsuta]
MIPRVLSAWAVLGLVFLTEGAIGRSITPSNSIVASHRDPDIKVTFQEVISPPSLTSHQPQPINISSNPHLRNYPLNVKSYSGYITLPSISADNQRYKANVFFWFIEARESPRTAPLTVWLQGGPGAASSTQVVSGHNGPCIVQPDAKSTAPNPWSWNSVSNMLYIDQPVQIGFSYDDEPVNVGGKGAFSSQDPRRTVNTTAAAARVIKELLSAWFGEFGQYKRHSINIWSRSYGGHFAPAVANLLLPPSKGSIVTHIPRGCRKRDHKDSNFHIGINSVGIINGIVDLVIQAPSYPKFAINNTYGIKAISDEAATLAMQSITKPGNRGTNTSVNSVCAAAFGFCWANVYGVYEAISGRNPFDITHPLPDPPPPIYGQEFLNSERVREELGARINFTDTSGVVASGFIATGDFVRGYTHEISSLLDAGVKVALIYGDRDYRANWRGGEAISLALRHASHLSFAATSYTDISTNNSYIGGKVRQHENLSFSRVFQAGHEVPYYQPQTAYEIFARTLRGLNIATGAVDATPYGKNGYRKREEPTGGRSSVVDAKASY